MENNIDLEKHINQFPEGIQSFDFIPNDVRNGIKKPCVQIHTLTRDLAEFLMYINFHNRDLRQRVAAGYKRDIEAGDWMLTNQGIGVITTEAVIDGAYFPVIYLGDGQHRISAFLQAGCPEGVEVIILWNMDPRAQKCIDLQAKRQARDLMKLLQNKRVAACAPAVARMVIKEKLGWQVSPTMTEIMNCMEEIAPALEQVLMVPKQSKFFAAPYITAFVKIAEMIPDEFYKLKNFMLRVETGEMLKIGDPELTLRNYILNSAGLGGGSNLQNDRYRKTLRAWKAFYEGEKLSLLR